MNDYSDDHQDSTEKLGQSGNEQSSKNRSAPALIEKFVIRLPKGLRKKIKHLSEQNRRSMNSEIIMVLEKHIQQYMAEDNQEFSQASSMEFASDSEGVQKLTDSELTRRLENLPEEKKQALLELLG